MPKYTFLLIMAFTLINVLPIFAQENTEISVTAEVIYPVVNIRNAPNTSDHPYFGGDTTIGQLHMGDVVWVNAMETIPQHRLWVYVTHDASGLTGWVVADLLLFSTVDWQRYVEQAGSTANSLIEFHAENTPENPIHTHIRPTTNGRRQVCVNTHPFEGEQAGCIPTGASVIALGAAERDGQRTCHVLIRSNDMGLEGWVYAGDALGHPMRIPWTHQPHCLWFKTVPIVLSYITPHSP